MWIEEDEGQKRSLDYAHSLGGRELLLPKTVRTCWDKVQKVRSSIQFLLLVCMNEFIPVHFVFITPITVYKSDVNSRYALHSS